MFLKSLSIVVLVFIGQFMYAQTPNWVQAVQRTALYPENKYILGYSEYKNQQDLPELEFIEKLKNIAQTNLIQSVQTTIESASVRYAEESANQFKELFMVSGVATSGMTISGLHFETFYDKKSKTGYVLAYADRQQVFENYKGILQRTKNNISQKLDQAMALKAQQTKQLTIINSCFTDFREAEEAQSIMYALKPTVNESEILLSEFKNLKTGVETLKSTLEKSVATDINEAASMLIFNIRNQLSGEVKTVRLVNLSYQDTKMGSTFSRRFSKSMEQKLASDAGLSVLTDITEQHQENVTFLLTGTYWEEGNNLRILLLLKNLQTTKTIASAETRLDLTWLTQNGINYKPENFQEAYSNMKAFSTNEVSGGGFDAELWTNKGDQNLIFTEGDKMKLFVRVNHECYIRVIYHMADASRVLLVDNYYIGSDKVNKVYELPFEFECSEPFGVETLQLNAQTNTFDALNVTKQDGYDFINDGLDKILVNTRGMKKVTQEVLKAEKRVVITTMRE